MAADGDGKKPPFRWLHAARYAVAAAVTVVIVVVIINAIKMVLRPDSLSVSILRGSVFVRRNRQPPELVFSFDFRAENPSGRVRMYYVNILACLFDKDTPALSVTPDCNNPVGIYLADEPPLAQHDTVDSHVESSPVKKQDMDPAYFDKLMRYDGGSIGEFTMGLNGSLITEQEIGSGSYNTTPQLTTYFCEPLLVIIGDPDDKAYQSMQDVRCQEVQAGKHFTS